MQRLGLSILGQHLLAACVGISILSLASNVSHADTIRKVSADGSITLTNLQSTRSSSGKRGDTIYRRSDGVDSNLFTNIKSGRGNENFSEYKTTVETVFYAHANIHQYQNYGANEAAVSSSGSGNKNAYDALIADAASRHRIDAALMKAIMHTESGFNPNARSPVGAQGLMQLMPATARRFNVSNAWDPAQNIEGSAKYIRWLLTRFNGRVDHVLAGYNAGEGNVDKYGGIPPFRETQDYVRRVLSRYNNLYANQSFQAQASSTNQPVSLAMNSNPAIASDSAYTQSAVAALGAPK